MNIIFIINADVGSPGSVGFRVLPVIEEALRRGHKVRVFARGGMRISSVRSKFMPGGTLLMKGLTFVQMQTGKSVSVARLRHSTFESFVRLNLSNDVLRWADVIHSWEFLPAVYKRARLVKPSIRIVQDVQMAFPEVLKELKHWNLIWRSSDLESLPNVRSALAYPDVFVVPSEFVKHSAIAAGVPSRKLRVVPFGVDHNAFVPRKKVQKAGTLKIAYVGSVNLRKGFHYFMNAIDELSLPVEVHIYGRVYSEAQSIVKRKNVFLHGHTDIKKTLHNHDLFVFPSLVEGSAKATYEAMACGLPVITTPNSGSLVRDGKDGFIVPAENSRILRLRIEKLARDPLLRARMGSSARARILPFTWQFYGKTVLDVLSSQ